MSKPLSGPVFWEAAMGTCPGNGVWVLWEADDSLGKLISLFPASRQAEQMLCSYYGQAGPARTGDQGQGRECVRRHSRGGRVGVGGGGCINRAFQGSWKQAELQVYMSSCVAHQGENSWQVQGNGKRSWGWPQCHLGNEQSSHKSSQACKSLGGEIKFAWFTIPELGVAVFSSLSLHFLKAKMTPFSPLPCDPGAKLATTFLHHQMALY